MSQLPTFPRAVVVLANYAQFKPGQKITNPCVYSRMLLWCIAGKGEVVINEKTYPVGAGDAFFLPWRHSVAYKADKADPFHLAGIHLVPDHAPGREVNYEVAHSIRHPLAGIGWRKDLHIPGFEGIVNGNFRDVPALAELADYIVKVYLRPTDKNDRMRRLAELLIQELIDAITMPGAGMAQRPPELRQLMAHIDNSLGEPLTLKGLAAVAGRSTATVGRLFREHLGCSPVAWITSVRMERARFLLTTTGKNVEEVGRAVGVPDPYYFSKLFKTHNGIAPRKYREGRSGI